MVGVIVEHDGETRAHRIIRDDTLDCLYGKSSKGAKRLLDTGLDTLQQVILAATIQDDLPDTLGLQAGPLRHTFAESVGEALRTAALLYSSLANIDRLDELEDTDAPSQEDTNRRFTTELRERVVEQKPELAQYFNRQAVLIDGGEPTRFGFCSTKSILHFGVLSPVRQSAGVRDARARLWELHRAREISGLQTAALVFAAPRLDDPTLSRQQVDAFRRNMHEIEREADSYDMRFNPVTSIDSGAERVLSYA